MNLSIQPLPALTLWGATTTVLDETDISQAVATLRGELPSTDADLVLPFDGTRDDQITVSAGIEGQPQGATQHELHAPAADLGVSVHVDAPPASVADAWVLIDAQLEARQLISGGIYRPIIGGDGRTTLQAPVRQAR